VLLAREFRIHQNLADIEMASTSGDHQCYTVNGICLDPVLLARELRIHQNLADIQIASPSG
jgi:hypothetical protein